MGNDAVVYKGSIAHGVHLGRGTSRPPLADDKFILV